MRTTLVVVLLASVAIGLAATVILYHTDRSSRQSDRATGEGADITLAPSEAGQGLPPALETALNSIQLGNYEQAIEDLRARTGDPQSAESALFLLARAQYESGDHAGSLATLDEYLSRFEDKLGAARALLLRAQQRIGLGDLAGAAIDLAEYSSKNRAGSSYAFMRLGDIALESGNTSGARSYYARALGSGLSTYTESGIMRQLADLSAAAGELEEAAYWAERVFVSSPSTEDRTASLAELAAIALQSGARDRWVELSRQLIAEFPGAREAQEALNELLEAGVPVSSVDHARVLIYQGDLGAAELRLLEGVAQGGRDESSAAAFQLGLLRELAGDSEGALSWFEQSLMGTDQPESLPLRRLHLLQNALLAGDGKAATDLAEFASANPGTVLAASAARSVAHWHDSESRPTAAAEMWMNVSRLASEANDSEGAADAARRAADRFAEAGDDDAARAALAAVSSSDPGSYAAIRAESLVESDELPAFYEERPVAGWLGEFARRQVSPAAERPSSATETALELGNAGLLSEADSELTDVARVSRYDPATLIELASAAWREGQYAASARAAGTLLANIPDEIRRGIPIEVGELAYPRPYLEVAEQEAAQVGLDPLLLFGLMRQESFFDPRAHSSANARGLTQIIPATADSIAGNLGLDGFEQVDLYRPSISLAFGAYYLRSQVDAFGGAIHAALAAYNGGPGNAQRWAEANGLEDLDAYIEQIDFAETYSYVRRVLEHYAHYRALYLEEARPSLPE